MPNPAESIGNGKRQEVEPTTSRELPSLDFFMYLPDIKERDLAEYTWEGDVILDGQKTTVKCRIECSTDSFLSTSLKYPDCFFGVQRGNIYEGWYLTEFPEYLSVNLIHFSAPSILVPNLQYETINFGEVNLYYAKRKEKPDRIMSSDIDIQKSSTDFFKECDPVHNKKLWYFSGDNIFITSVTDVAECVVNGLAKVVDAIKKTLPPDPNSTENFPTS